MNLARQHQWARRGLPAYHLCCFKLTGDRSPRSNVANLQSILQRIVCQQGDNGVATMQKDGAMMHVPSRLPHAPTQMPVLEPRLSRRRFMRYAFFSLLGAVAATSAVATARSLYPTKITGFGAPVVAGSVAEVRAALSERGYVQSNVGRFYVLPAAPDAAIAVYWQCKHVGCIVPPPDASGRIECQCHNARYDGKTGALLSGPARQPLDFMPIIIDRGYVIVDTGKITTRDAYDPRQTTLLK